MCFCSTSRLGSENGIDLLKAIRRMPKYETLPVILLTGCTNKTTVLEIARLGVQGYVLKSQFSRDDLVTRINKQLENHCPASPTIKAATSTAKPAGDVEAVTPIQPEANSAVADSLRSLRRS